jgi:hypothetical protein
MRVGNEVAANRQLTGNVFVSVQESLDLRDRADVRQREKR